MLNKLAYRQLSETDLNSFFSLRLEALQKYPSYFLATYEHEKACGNQFFAEILRANALENVIFGAFERECLIGIVGIYQEKAVKVAHKCTVWGMYVKVEYRKQGVGKRLLEMAIDHAEQKMHGSVINLSVESNNLTAMGLYEAHGFKAWGKEPKAKYVNEAYHDLVHMSLLL